MAHKPIQFVCEANKAVIRIQAQRNPNLQRQFNQLTTIIIQIYTHIIRAFIVEPQVIQSKLLQHSMATIYQFLNVKMLWLIQIIKLYFTIVIQNVINKDAMDVDQLSVSPANDTVSIS